MNGYKIVLLKAIFMLYRLPESERVCSGICTYHQSRHTLGTMMVSAVVPIESISKRIEHTNIIVTREYAEVTDDNISEDMDRLI